MRKGTGFIRPPETNFRRLALKADYGRLRRVVRRCFGSDRQPQEEDPDVEQDHPSDEEEDGERQHGADDGADTQVLVVFVGEGQD